MAASACRPDLVEALVDAGADASCSDAMNMTALHYSAENSDSRSIEALVAQYTVDRQFLISPLGVAALKGCIDTVKLLHTKGLDVRHGSDETPLFCAVRGGNSDVVAYLLKNGAKSRRPKSNGYYPIHVAAVLGHLDIVMLLIDEDRGNVKLTDCYRRTPLHIAAEVLNLPMVKYLVSKGADVNKVERWGLTPLNFGENTFPDASLPVLIAVIDFLVSVGADINGRDKNPLFSATLTNNVELVEYFAALGSNVHQEYHNSCPLQIAARKGSLEVAKTCWNTEPNLLTQQAENRL